MSTTEKLKPCPFCGSSNLEKVGFDVRFKERPHIKCNGCGVDVYDVPSVMPIWHRHDSMVQAWNARATLGSEPKPLDGGKVIHSCDTDAEYAETSTCECVGTILWEWGVPPAHYEHELSCGHVITSTEEEPPNYCEMCGAKVRKEVGR